MGSETAKYLGYARECLKQAEEAESQQRRDKLVELAQVWMKAAALAEGSYGPARLGVPPGADASPS
jgi:hypothetical protein